MWELKFGSKVAFLKSIREDSEVLTLKNEPDYSEFNIKFYGIKSHIMRMFFILNRTRNISEYLVNSIKITEIESLFRINNINDNLLKLRILDIIIFLDDIATDFYNKKMKVK